MDPISITASILSSVLTIKAWIDDRQRKDKAIKDLSTTINLVHLILSPLSEKAPTLHPSIVASLLTIGEVLSRIKEHLSIWKDKRASISISKLVGFITPGSVVGDLRDDAALLAQHVQTVAFAVQVSTFLAEREREKEKEVPAAPSLLELIKNEDVRMFWADMVGVNVSAYKSYLCVRTDNGCRHSTSPAQNSANPSRNGSNVNSARPLWTC